MDTLYLESCNWTAKTNSLSAPYKFYNLTFLFSIIFLCLQSPKKPLTDEGAKSTTTSNSSTGNRRYSSSSDNDLSGASEKKSTPVNAARVEPNLRAAPVVDQQRSSSSGFDSASRENSTTNMRSAPGNFTFRINK